LVTIAVECPTFLLQALVIFAACWILNRTQQQIARSHSFGPSYFLVSSYLSRRPLPASRTQTARGFCENSIFTPYRSLARCSVTENELPNLTAIMAPPAKGQPKPARSAPSNPKKHHSSSPSASAHSVAAPNNRQHVVPAIPLALMHRQSNSISKAGAKPSPAHAHVPAASSSSNTHRVFPLEAAVVEHDLARSPRISEGDVQQQSADSAGQTIVLPLRHEKKAGTSESQANGVSHTNTETSSRVEATSGKF